MADWLSSDDRAERARPGENESEDAKDPVAAVEVDGDCGVREVKLKRAGIDERNPLTVDDGLAPRLWLVLLLPLLLTVPGDESKF